jgi:hypothetical protein
MVSNFCSKFSLSVLIDKKESMEEIASRVEMMVVNSSMMVCSKTVRQMQRSNDKETKPEQVSRCPQDMLGGFIGHAVAEIDPG